MATRKKHLINVHTSTGTTAPTGASLYLGEIAVQHTPDEPGLWIKMGTSESSDEYEKFIGETRITNMLSEARILGSAYTYTGLPQVNSATTLEAAYSALTKEVVDGSLVVASALNDLNGRVIEISGNTPDMTNYYDKGEVEHIISVSGGTDVSPLSGAVVSLSAGTHAHVTNGDIHVTAAQKTTWTNGSNSGASAYTGVTQLSGVVESLEDEVAKIAVTAVTVTGEGNAVTAATYAGSALTLAMGDVDMTLGSGYTYSGLPYVTSATSLADAYSALTMEMIDDEKVVSEALNDLDLRVKELSGNSGSGTLTGVSAGGTEVPVTGDVAAIPSASSSVFGVVKTGDFLTNTNGTISISTGTTSSTVARGDHTHDEYAATATLNALSASVTANRDAISALTDSLDELSGAVWNKEYVIAMAMNDLNGRINTLSGESADYALEADLVSLSASVISNKGAVTAVTVTGTGSVVTDAVYADSALTLTKGNPEVTLGPDYTYSGLPYVNSATVLADAYSALTSEVVAGLSAVVESNEYVAAMALNDLDRRITEISGNTGGDVDPLSAAVISLSAAVITISGNTGGGGDIQPLSSATHTHINNNDIHVTAADKTAWTNGANSGASAWTAVTELSAATTAHTGNALIHVPTGGTDGQYLSLVNGTPTWSTPVTVYSGENPPARSLGNNGDIYIQTS